MRQMGIRREVFKDWLKDEKLYLEALTKEPIQETLEIEYYQRLESLNKARYVDFHVCIYLLRL